MELYIFKIDEKLMEMPMGTDNSTILKGTVNIHRLVIVRSSSHSGNSSWKLSIQVLCRLGDTVMSQKYAPAP